MAINKVSVQEGSKEESPLFVFAHYIWWKRSDDALADERRLIAQVMNIATWEDVRRMEKIVSQKYLAGILKNAQPGWFSPRKWNFWHYRIGLVHWPVDIPPVPIRRFYGQ